MFDRINTEESRHSEFLIHTAAYKKAVDVGKGKINYELNFLKHAEYCNIELNHVWYVTVNKGRLPSVVKIGVKCECGRKRVVDVKVVEFALQEMYIVGRNHQNIGVKC